MAERKDQSTGDAIRTGIGDISAFETYSNLILVGIYMRPEKSKGGIIFTDKTIEEDRWQGNAGLVLAKGPMAFVDDGANDFHGQTVSDGDWVVFRTSDGIAIDVNGIHCRLLQDVHVMARISDPTMVY